jgi:hypothetical protein
VEVLDINDIECGVKILVAALKQKPSL